MFWISDPAGQPASVEISVVLLKPRSRGRVRLGSGDTTAPPVIELPGLSDPADVERLVEGYRRAYDIAHSPGIRRHCSGEFPAEPGSDAELRDLIGAERYSIPHVVGTCSMGPRPDDGAVVDASGRVHGTEALSVADASIMPDVPSGFTHIPAIMIAERLSEVLGAVL
jgi:choline dehydrogenase